VTESRYSIGHVLGRGRHGEVCLAVDRRDQRTVALKRVSLDARATDLEDFQNELNALRRSKHIPEVVHLVDGFADAGVPPRNWWIAMEICEGSASDWMHMNENGGIDLRRCFGELCRGLAQLHRSGIYHLDIKADNLLLARDDANLTLRFADFGRCRDIYSSHHSDSDYERGRGQLRFAPPELLWHLGSSSAECMRMVDLYGLGQSMYEVATGYSLNLATISGAATSISLEEHSYDKNERKKRFACALPELKHRYLEAWLQLTAIGVASEIRNAIMLLSDPDPRMRHRVSLFRLARSLLT
jgi:serine/threonine protein kinase